MTGMFGEEHITRFYNEIKLSIGNFREKKVDFSEKQL